MSLTLLVPLDGSALSERAISYAAALAGTAGRIFLVRAVDEETSPELSPESGLRPGMRLSARYLAPFIQAIRNDGVTALPLVAPGRAADVIARAARDVPADLIVMSTHSRGLIGRWLFGSVADEVVRTAAAPILLLPPHLDVSAKHEQPRILVPLDGSDAAAAVLDAAVDLAHHIGADVVLVRAIPMPLSIPASDKELGRVGLGVDVGPDLVSARTYLEEIAAQIRPRVPVADVRVDVGDPAAAIRTAARECGVSMIAMATHARTGVARAVLGSVTERTLHDAEEPVLVVRPAGVHVRGAVAPRQQATEPFPAILGVTSVDVEIVATALDIMLSCLSTDDAQRARATALIDQIRHTWRSGMDGDHRLTLDPADQTLVTYALDLALSPLGPRGDGTQRTQELLDRIHAATRADEQRPMALAQVGNRAPVGPTG